MNEAAPLTTDLQTMRIGRVVSVSGSQLISLLDPHLGDNEDTARKPDIGEVVNVHIDDALIVDGMIDLARIRPLARLGYMDYSVVDNIFTMPRV